MPEINIALVFVEFAVLLFSLTIHEAAHAWTADRLGDPTARMLGRISLNPLVHADPIGTVLFPLLALFTRVPLIGWAKPVPVNILNLPRYRRDYVLIAAAGPAANVLLAVAASMCLRIFSNTSPAIASITLLMIELNLLLAVFNMIPVPPLDGGNVLAGLLPGALADKFDSIRPYGFLIIYALLFTGVLSYLVSSPYSPYTLLLSWLHV